MQEGIKQIGESIFNKENILMNLVKDIKYKDNKDNYMNIIQINFNTKSGKIEIVNFGEASKDSPKDLLWIGTATGPSSPQWYTTGNKAEYLISQTIPNLIEMDIDGLSQGLKDIRKEFYFDMGEQKGSRERFRYVIDMNKIHDLVDREINISEIYKENKEDVRKTVKSIAKTFDKYIEEKLDLKAREIALYFLSIDSKPLSENQGYKNSIKKERYTLDSKAPVEPCSVCGQEKQVTPDTSKLQLKFYTTTNINFPSNFSKSNYHRNMQICSDCMSFLVSGEQYIRDNLNSRLGGCPVYIIPHFLYEPNLSKEKMDDISRNIKMTFKEAKNVESIGDFRDEVEIHSDTYKNYFLLNLLFYRINQKAVKVQKLIKDVNPSRFHALIDSSKEVRNQFKKLFRDDFKIPLGLQSVYYLTPVKLKQGEVQDYSRILSLYDNIFKRGNIKKEVLITNFLNMIKIHYFDKQGTFNISPSNFFSRNIIQSHMLIKYLEKIDCLKEGKGMELDSIILGDEIKDYMETMRYSDEEGSLFLLGYLVAQVGNKQRVEREGKKPILNKINFNSMDLNKVKRLSNEIPEKLRQNGVLKYNEKEYFAHKKLMDKHRNNWNLSKHDNLYYIMSGYAYGSTKAIYRKEK